MTMMLASRLPSGWWWNSLRIVPSDSLVGLPYFFLVGVEGIPEKINIWTLYHWLSFYWEQWPVQPLQGPNIKGDD